MQERQSGLPKVVREIAWKAQLRLGGRYRRLVAKGKRQTVVATAIAREMSAFLGRSGSRSIRSRPADRVDGLIVSYRGESPTVILVRSVGAGPRWGTLQKIVWQALCRRPREDRGSPRRTYGNAGRMTELLDRYRR